MSKAQRDQAIPEKVILQKTGTHVEVTAGPYTKRQLREMLMSAISVLSSDREAELIRQSGVDPEDLQRMKFGDADDDDEMLENPDKISSAMRLVDLITEANTKSDLINLLRSKGISDDLINRILKYGLTDEVIRLLKALGFTDEDIARMFGMLEMLSERWITESEESCLSAVSSSAEYMSLDGFYLMSHFRNPLTKALGDIVSKKPWNPAEYLGHWLLNYKMCEERAQKQKEFDAELQAERERRRVKVITEPNVSEVDAEEGEELADVDWNFREYEED